ncbi:MAG: DMT family transporter [Proteobacteria bacterium]|nr:DMT family transporter [Pseudomonadota bacterium]
MGGQGRALAAFVLVAVIWGSTWLVIKDQIGTTSHYWTVTWRFVCGALGMVALVLARGERLWLPPRAWALVVPLGLVQFCFNFQFVYAAEGQITSGLVAVIYALLMVPNAVLGRIFLGTPVSRGFIIGSLVAIAGITLLMGQEYRLSVAAGHGGSVPLGVAFALCGLMGASTSNILQATPRARELPLLPVLAAAMAVGATADALIALAMVGPPDLPASVRFWGGVAWLGLAGSVVTFPLYFALIREWGAGRAAYNGVLVPVVAMALSTLFEDFRWSAPAAWGSALALAGLLIALTGNQPGKSAASPSR